MAGWGVGGGQAQWQRPSPNLNLIAVLPPSLKTSLLSACCVLSWALRVRRGRNNFPPFTELKFIGGDRECKRTSHRETHLEASEKSKVDDAQLQANPTGLA